MRKAAAMAAAIVMAGCANDFEIKKHDGSAIPLNGVPFHRMGLYRVTYEFSERVDANGNRTGTSGGSGRARCQPVVQKEEIQTLVDYSETWLIINKPPALSPGKFSVGLTNGVLSSVGAESNPATPQMISSLIKPADILGTLGGAAVGDACNAGPTIRSIIPYSLPK
jgi:hypothetical protein